MKLDLSKIDNIEFDDIEHRDAPDYSNAYIGSADYDGREMTVEELNYLNDVHNEWVHGKLYDHLY